MSILMRVNFAQNIYSYILEFSKCYHRFRVEADHLHKVKYKIISTLEDYHQTKKICLGFTDCPGDTLPPMQVQQIKKTPDIIKNMHPVDVNSLNDLYYLERDNLAEVKIFGENIISTTHNGIIHTYNLNDPLDFKEIHSTRVAYMIGLMQSEKLLQEAYKENERYKIVKDNITALQIVDKKTERNFLKNPMDILFTKEYKQYSKDDIAKIGYICGQMSKN